MYAGNLVSNLSESDTIELLEALCSSNKHLLMKEGIQLREIAKNITNRYYKSIPDPTLDEINLYKSGERISAIKEYRDRTRITLMDAKTKLERIVPF